jgi:hypothetical protein
MEVPELSEELAALATRTALSPRFRNRIAAIVRSHRHIEGLNVA